MLPSQRPSSQPEGRGRLRLLPRQSVATGPTDSLASGEPDRIGLWDRLAFSSLLAAAVAPALCAAAALSLGLRPDPATLALAFAGTLAVYSIDRLRDLERDRVTAPVRSAFVARNQLGLGALAAGGVGGGVAAALALDPLVWALCGVVLGLGLFHRRLKGRNALGKSAYVTGAWLAITVAVPALEGGAKAQEVPWVAAIYGGAIGANLVATNASRLAAAGQGWTLAGALRLAGALAAAGVGMALLAPSQMVPLAWVPLLQLASLLGFQRGERYRLIALDGSLGLGALLAALLLY